MNGARRAVVALDSFQSKASEKVAGKHPGVTPTGGVTRGTRLWSNDQIVVLTPHLFADESLVPGSPEAPASAAAPADGPSGREWRALVVAHRKSGEPRPKLRVVASNMGWDSEQPLRDLIHHLGFTQWRDVHAAVAGEPY